ncbi:MAG: hypothetical protein ACTSPQ_20865 [Candidatus Helarchaeota archaeon]
MFTSKYRFYLIWTIVIVILIIVGTCNISKAGDWKFNIMGITSEHLESRNWKVVVFGALSSLVIHEAGHLLWAKSHGGGHFDWDERAVFMDDYDNRSHSEQQMFHRAGFLTQLIVGGVLTVVPKMRHLDFTVGFNSFTTIEINTYMLFDRGNEETSDVRQLNHGVFECVVYTLGAGTLTYINIKDHNSFL